MSLISIYVPYLQLFIIEFIYQKLYLFNLIPFNLLFNLFINLFLQFNPIRFIVHLLDYFKVAAGHSFLPTAKIRRVLVFKIWTKRGSRENCSEIGGYLKEGGSS